MMKVKRLLIFLKILSRGRDNIAFETFTDHKKNFNPSLKISLYNPQLMRTQFGFKI